MAVVILGKLYVDVLFGFMLFKVDVPLEFLSNKFVNHLIMPDCHGLHYQMR